MRTLFLTGIVAGLMLAAPRAQQQVQLLASIVDETGQAVGTLAPEDVRVVENGSEAKVVKVEPVDKRVTLQLLLDNGVGLGSENLLHLRNGVRALLEKLPEGLEVTMVTTAPQPRFLVRATTDRKALLQGVDRLTPDTGAGRFVESLNEATQRIQREKPDTAPIIISAATTSGDTNVMERDIEQLMRRVQERPTTVHVIVLSGGVGRTASGGGNQTTVGIAVTDATRGRYEGINAGTRLATLLPELGDLVAAAVKQQSRQYRVVADRPSGAKGDVGSLSLGVTRAGLKVVGVTRDSTGR
jgi:hypothetical protein